MGIIDDLTNTFNKGAAAAERGVKTVKLKAQVGDLEKQRQELCAQLGASLYEVTKDNAALCAGRESLYDGIAACDAEKEACLHQIEEIEQQAAQEAAASAASETLTCTVCGSSVGASDSFCSGCGTSVEQIRSTTSVTVATSSYEQEAVCTTCGHSVSPSDSFCMECGAKVI